MDIDDVQAIGKRLFGRRWQAPLARAIGVAPETVSRWLHQKQRISSSCQKAILQLTTSSQYIHYREKRSRGSARTKVIGNSCLLLGSADTITLTQAIDVIFCDPFGSKPLPEISKAMAPEYYLSSILKPLYAKLKKAGKLMMVLDRNADPRLLSVLPSTLMFAGRIAVGTQLVYCFARVAGAFKLLLFANDNLQAVPTLQALLADFTMDTEVICDPFMGEGQIADAATHLGRHYIGFECEYRYWMSVCTRLAGL